MLRCRPTLCHEVQCQHSGDAAIERIRTEFAMCAAPHDAILAEIAWEATAFETAPSPHRPTSYVDAILSTMGGGTQPSLPLALSPSALAPAALPSPDVDGQLQPVRQRARPRCRTGRHNYSRAPSPPGGPTLPPTPNAGWASYTNFYHVGTSDLTLSHGGVINYALLDGTAYSIPPTFYFSW
jgi:hypothetical protein